MASVTPAAVPSRRSGGEAPPTVSRNIEAPLIEAQGLGVRGRERWLVRGVDLSIRPGEIVTLIGPNGSGKSTTVKALLGILKTAEGALKRRDDLRIGYVPQKLSIDYSMPLTVRRLMTLTGRHRREDIETALAEVGIADLVDRPVQQLSGGEFQRALLARALIRRPQLLVLDEPVQGVDFGGEIALYELISEIRDRLGCAILMISHDLHIVMGQTDTVICLNGHVCCSGTPQTVTASPEYRALFGSRAAAALAIYRHDHDHVHLPDGTVVGDGHDHGDHHHHQHAEPARHGTAGPKGDSKGA